MKQNKKWVINKTPSDALTELYPFPEILKQLLYRRGCKTEKEARNFLEALQPSNTLSVWPKGISEAVDRIQHAIRKNERVIIYGDYDVDGITAVAVLAEILEKMGCDVRTFIPHRIDDGYGLKASQFHFFKMNHIDLVITVDCGIRSLEAAEKAKEVGIDLIITDHHPPGPNLPDALIINPMQPGDSYPEKYLAGVGLAYKLAHALTLSHRPPLTPNILLDLVALGTVADMSPLLGENRYLVKQGLYKLRHTSRVGLRALADVSYVDLSVIQSNDIGFTLGPRLNAAGRLESGNSALKLLLTKDLRSAKEMANELNELNRQRKRLTHDAVWDAKARVDVDDPAIVVHNYKYNPGIIGLVATQLRNAFYKPAFVICNVGEIARGSCRSIPEYHIGQALERQTDILLSHGGHAGAAGFSIKPKDIDELANRLKADVRDVLGDTIPEPTINADVEIPLRNLDREMLEMLEWLEPFGEGNPKPVFISRCLQVGGARTVGSDDDHLIMQLSDGTLKYDAIAFRQGHWIKNMPAKIDVIYTANCKLNANHCIDRVQLIITDIKESK